MFYWRKKALRVQKKKHCGKVEGAGGSETKKIDEIEFHFHHKLPLMSK